jgi:hypothetical protein
MGNHYKIKNYYILIAISGVIFKFDGLTGATSKDNQQTVRRYFQDHSIRYPKLSTICSYSQPLFVSDKQ